MASESPTPSPKAQPKIVQKLGVRTLVAVLLLGTGFLGVRWYLNNRNDITNLGTAETAGMVAAVEYLDNGSKVVAFDAKGAKVEPAGYRTGASERDLAWQPDGNRLFFVSDRDPKVGFQVYRWKPGSSEEPSPRSMGTQGKSNPSFPAEATPDANQFLLMTSRGVVLELDPKDQKMHQVLPPVGAEISQGGEGDESGTTSAFTGIYGRLGESFRVARWCAEKQAVAAVMRRSGGEILIVQPLPRGNEKTPPPIPIAAGDRIDFDVSPKDGSIVFAVQSFQWPTEPDRKFVKDGKVTRPFSHYVGIFKPGQSGPADIIVASPNDNGCFGSPAISPAGDKVLLTYGKFDASSESMTTAGLVTMPARSLGAQAATKLAEGSIFEPTWNTAGDKIAYAKRGPSGKRSIYVANADGSGETNISGESGNFGSPKFSPQTAK